MYGENKSSYHTSEMYGFPATQEMVSHNAAYIGGESISRIMSTTGLPVASLKEIQVVDTDTGEPIELAHVLTGKGKTITNQNGIAIVEPAHLQDTVTISHVSYGTRSFNYSSLGSLVNLDKVENGLDTAVVTGGKPSVKKAGPNWLLIALGVGAIFAVSGAFSEKKGRTGLNGSSTSKKSGTSAKKKGKKKNRKKNKNRSKKRTVTV